MTASPSAPPSKKPSQRSSPRIILPEKRRATSCSTIEMERKATIKIMMNAKTFETVGFVTVGTRRRFKSGVKIMADAKLPITMSFPNSSFTSPLIKAETANVMITARKHKSTGASVIVNSLFGGFPVRLERKTQPAK